MTALTVEQVEELRKGSTELVFTHLAALCDLALAALSARGGEPVDIVFDAPPGPEGGRFVEVESPPGKGIRFGDWVKREDGYWALRFYTRPQAGQVTVSEQNAPAAAPLRPALQTVAYIGKYGLIVMDKDFSDFPKGTKFYAAQGEGSTSARSEAATPVRAPIDQAGPPAAAPSEFVRVPRAPTRKMMEVGLEEGMAEEARCRELASAYLDELALVVEMGQKLRALTPPADGAESVIPAPTEQQIDAAMQGYEWPEAWDDQKVREVCCEVWHLMHGA